MMYFFRRCVVLLLFVMGFTSSIFSLDIKIPNNIKPDISIEVKNLQSGSVIYSLNQYEPRLIASNVKLFTSYFALKELGADFKWATSLYYDGTIDDGVLNGNIYLVGGGDPTLNNATIYNIFSILKRYNIYKINGNVVLDGSIFNQILKYSFLDTNQYDTDSILPSGLMINHEKTEVQLHIVGSTVTLTSNLYGVKLKNQLQVNKTESLCYGIYNSIKITKNNDLITLSGKVPKECNNKNLSYRFLSNFAYNRTIVYQILEDFNIRLNGDVVSGNCDIKNSKLIYTNYSNSLSTILVNMNKNSDNLIAETLVLSIGAYKTSNIHTYDEAMQKYNAFLNSYNLLNKRTKIENGAGLSRFEFFTVNGVTSLLSMIYKSKDYPLFVSTLPVPNQDGSLKNRFKDFQGNLYAKTGTLNDTIALSGYFINNFGVPFVFSIIFNNVDDYPSSQVKQIDAIITDIFKQLNYIK